MANPRCGTSASLAESWTLPTRRLRAVHWPSTTPPGRSRGAFARATLLQPPGPFGFNRNDCSASAEMTVRLPPKSVFGLGRNRCSACSEMAVRFRPSYTPTRNTYVSVGVFPTGSTKRRAGLSPRPSIISKTSCTGVPTGSSSSAIAASAKWINSQSSCHASVPLRRWNVFRRARPRACSKLKRRALPVGANFVELDLGQDLCPCAEAMPEWASVSAREGQSAG